MSSIAIETMATGFRSVMAAFPTGVSVVTSVGPDGKPWGMTCSSLCSVTLTPPTLLVSLRWGSPTLGAILGQARFAVNLLRHDAQAVAELFSSGRPDRFARVRWHCGPGLGGPELPDDAHAAVHCDVGRVERVGDHAVIFGAVFRVREPAGPARPLLYGLRGYAAWPRRAAATPPPRAAVTPASAHERPPVALPRIYRCRTRGKPFPYHVAIPL